jgi:AbrB family looped-hinge helix DNA binding protein
MNAQTTLSSKGQVVVPKAIRDALHLKPGEVLTVTREGRRIVLEAIQPECERISYAEFKRRIPAYEGPPVRIEDMHSGIAEIFTDWRV